MDRFTSNTLRTLGIVAISIFVIVGCLLLLLLALCAGMLGAAGNPAHHDPRTTKLFYGSILAAAILVIIGVLSIAKLAKGIVRESTALPAPQPESQSLPPSPPSPRSQSRTTSPPTFPPPAVRPFTPSSSPSPRKSPPRSQSESSAGSGLSNPHSELPPQRADRPGLGGSFKSALSSAPVRSP